MPKKTGSPPGQEQETEMAVIVEGQIAEGAYSDMRKYMAQYAKNLDFYRDRLVNELTDWNDTFGPLTGIADNGYNFILKYESGTAPTWDDIAAAAVEFEPGYATVQQFKDDYETCRAESLIFRDWMRDDANVRRDNVDYSDPLTWQNWAVPESVQKLDPNNTGHDAIRNAILAAIDQLRATIGTL